MSEGSKNIRTTWSPRSPTRAILALIGVTSLIRLAFAWATGLCVDESYMVAAGRVLSGGYFDHPPAAWWLSWGASHLFASEAPVAVRLPFILLFALSTWLMVRLGSAVADERAGFWAAVLLNLSPVFGVTGGTWVLPDGPLLCALLGAALCLVHATGSSPSPSWSGLTRPPPETRAPLSVPHLPEAGGSGPTMAGGNVGWWFGAGLCAGLALSAKYSAALTIGGAFLFLLCDRRQRRWLARPQPYVAAAIAALVFSPVIIWNATHGWASFAFQGERAVGLRFHPFAPVMTLLGEGLFVLPWIWAPLLVVWVRALRAPDVMMRVQRPVARNSGPMALERLLAFLAAPPIVVFALISAWSSQRILFHWAAPGYLMLFPLLGREVAAHLHLRWVRRTIAGTAAFVLAIVTIIGIQTRFDVVGDRLSAVMRKDPTIEGIDWASLRADLTERRLLRPGTIVGVANWRDGGKIAYALGPDAIVLCLNADARQFGFANPPAQHIGQDVLLIGLSPVAGPFERIEPLPPATIRHQGRILAAVSVAIGHHLNAWPPPK